MQKNVAAHKTHLALVSHTNHKNLCWCTTTNKYKNDELRRPFFNKSSLRCGRRATQCIFSNKGFLRYWWVTWRAHTYSSGSRLGSKILSCSFFLGCRPLFLRRPSRMLSSVWWVYSPKAWLEFVSYPLENPLLLWTCWLWVASWIAFFSSFSWYTGWIVTFVQHNIHSIIERCTALPGGLKLRLLYLVPSAIISMITHSIWRFFVPFTPIRHLNLLKF